MSLKVGRADVRTFFETVCPLLLPLAPMPRPTGRIAFCLSGPMGGSWTVDLGAGSVTRGAAHVDTTLRSSAVVFEAMLAGKIVAADAFADGRMQCDGNADLLGIFANLLATHVPAQALEREIER